MKAEGRFRKDEGGRMKDEAVTDKPAQTSSFIPHPSAFSRWRNAILGTLLVIGGLSAAAVTLLARQSDNYALAAVAAVLSLVSAALMLLFVVPPLDRWGPLGGRRFALPVGGASWG